MKSLEGRSVNYSRTKLKKIYPKRHRTQSLHSHLCYVKVTFRIICSFIQRTRCFQRLSLSSARLACQRALARKWNVFFLWMKLFCTLTVHSVPVWIRVIYTTCHLCARHGCRCITYTVPSSAESALEKRNHLTDTHTHGARGNNRCHGPFYECRCTCLVDHHKPSKFDLL